MAGIDPLAVTGREWDATPLPTKWNKNRLIPRSCFPEERAYFREPSLYPTWLNHEERQQPHRAFLVQKNGSLLMVQGTVVFIDRE